MLTAWGSPSVGRWGAAWRVSRCAVAASVFSARTKRPPRRFRPCLRRALVCFGRGFLCPSRAPAWRVETAKKNDREATERAAKKDGGARAAVGRKNGVQERHSLFKSQARRGHTAWPDRASVSCRRRHLPHSPTGAARKDARTARPALLAGTTRPTRRGRAPPPPPPVGPHVRSPHRAILWSLPLARDSAGQGRSEDEKRSRVHKKDTLRPRHHTVSRQRV